MGGNEDTLVLAHHAIEKRHLVLLFGQDLQLGCVYHLQPIFGSTHNKEPTAQRIEHYVTNEPRLVVVQLLATANPDSQLVVVDTASVEEASSRHELAAESVSYLDVLQFDEFVGFQVVPQCYRLPRYGCYQFIRPLLVVPAYPFNHLRQPYPVTLLSVGLKIAAKLCGRSQGLQIPHTQIAHLQLEVGAHRQKLSSTGVEAYPLNFGVEWEANRTDQFVGEGLCCGGYVVQTEEFVELGRSVACVGLPVLQVKLDDVLHAVPLYSGHITQLHQLFYHSA